MTLRVLGKHMKAVKLTPSDPNYVRNLLGPLRRATWAGRRAVSPMSTTACQLPVVPGAGRLSRQALLAAPFADAPGLGFCCLAPVGVGGYGVGD